MSAPPPSRVASGASTLTAPTSACVWMVMKPWSATPIRAKPCQVSLFVADSQPLTVLLTWSLTQKMCLISAEEPFLIMADHHEIRKLSVDGSNYTILKQVSQICSIAASQLWRLLMLIHLYHNDVAPRDINGTITLQHHLLFTLNFKLLLHLIPGLRDKDCRYMALNGLCLSPS